MFLENCVTKLYHFGYNFCLFDYIKTAAHPLSQFCKYPASLDVAFQHI